MWEGIWINLKPFVPALVAGLALLTSLAVISRIRVARRLKSGVRQDVFWQVLVLALGVLGGALVLLLLPLGDVVRGQLIGLSGILITGIFALSSTTFVANAMAGLMLRMVKSFRVGDFIQVGGLMGRVTERGLFHTEIQNEDRELTSFPNLHLVTNPVVVVRSSGTMVSATLSLGYDLPPAKIEPLLVSAAEQIDLKDPFVQIKELGDFSITYKVSGLFPDVKKLLTARSNLKRMILSTLHGEGIEIVSPKFVNQRVFPTDRSFVPRKQELRSSKEIKEEKEVEEHIFDKAESAEELERLRDHEKVLQTKIGEAGEASEAERAQLDRELAETSARIVALVEEQPEVDE